ncbi:hypothetical protein JQ604_25590 [Bradyrhizobium jicamae]|uniref:hypothetical protein n=1 Tax=Bradyrhizobium jicamae TaxID=280332 RepID=UPI001BAD29F9|nr:hypothetical protein [Bradyrhizobium jicamae]MBR0755568.1 hypothetical protein [Bradyrhizobium jicamae]
MHDREPTFPGSIWPNDAAGAPTPSADLWDLSNANHDAAALLQEPARDRMRIAALGAAALAATFALGWAGALSWHEFTDTPAPSQVVQKAAPVPRVAEVRPSSKSEGPRRAVPASGPSITGSIPKTSASPRLPALAAAPATANAPSIALAMPQPLAPAPETRPSTIPGWSVVEVRDGTAVLEGPDGVRMAARGDVVAGLGRVDSIVRWGNRWIVATASGLIATP